MGYASWKYQYELNIANPSSVEGFQGEFILTYQIGMRRNFNDLRFSTIRGEPLNHYIENIVNFQSCRVYISLPANEKKILMYYGNGAARSESDASKVFDFYDTFSTVNNTTWSVDHGTATSSNEILILKNTTLNSILTSKASYPVNSLIEINARHDKTNRCIIGFQNPTSKKAAVWTGTVSGDTNYYDHMLTNDGSYAKYISDGISRGNNTYYIYGIAHIAAGDKFYVNSVLRGTAESSLPGNVSLPIYLYSEAGKAVYIDWIRVRKYAVNAPIITLGKRRLKQSAGYLFLDHDRYEDNVTINIIVDNVLTDHYTDNVPVYIKAETYLGAPDQITVNETIIISIQKSEVLNREELSDYPLNTCDVSKSISDAYMQLSADFISDKAPPEGATIKHVVRDIKYVKHTIFSGKVLTKTPKLSYIGNSVSIQAADISRNLSVQQIPWNYQTISLDSTHTHFGKWILELLDTGSTGVYPGNIAHNIKPDKQFAFKPESTRMEAIKDIAEYMGCIINVKLIEQYIDGTVITTPALYAVQALDIDQKHGGFDLPAPIEFYWPDDSIIDEPTITGEQDVKYNSVLVHGILSSTGETVVAFACTPEVANGGQWANTYPIEDNTIYEKGTSAEIEAVKWLLYFSSPQSTVQMKFIERFDFELYQRVRFGKGFSNELRNLTNSAQLPYVVTYDPRDKSNTTHRIDVSGVPTPSWLRINEIKYHSELNQEYCEIKMITDYIYSSADPVVHPPYSTYIAPGYYKPVSDDTVSTIQSVVNDTVTKQLTPEVGTLLSIDMVKKTGVVQTASGKLVTVQLSWL